MQRQFKVRSRGRAAWLAVALLVGCSAGTGGTDGGEEEQEINSDMVLVPASGFVASGQAGGPFAPSSRSFTWTNEGLADQEYVRTISVAWLDATGPASGTVAPGQQIQFDVSLNAAADSLPVGLVAGSVELRDTAGQLLENIGFSVLVEPPNGPQVTVNRSTFTSAPHHAHFSAMNTVLQTGGLEDARIAWVAQAAGGAVIDGKVGGPEFGMVFEQPGDYVVTLRVMGQGESTWAERSVPITVDAPTYQAECWLDPSAGSNGTGTNGSPFNNWGSATTYIENNWSNGATNEHCIHIRRGTSASTNSAWNSGATARVGRLVYKPYGTGAKPQVAHATGSWVTIHGDNAFAAVDLDVTGDSSPGSFLFVSHINAGDGSDGHNVILAGCDFHDCGNGLYFNDLGNTTAAHVANGEFDFVAVKNCTTDNSYQIHTLAPRTRFVLYQNNFWCAVQTQFGLRFNHIQHADFRNNVHERAVGTASIFRIHSSLAGADTQWISVTDCTFGDETWIGPDAGASHAPYPMRHIWIERCRVDGTGRTWALAAFATERLVIRNCWARGLGSCINHRDDGGTTVATNWVIEGNSMVGEQNSGTFGRGWRTTVPALTDVTFRNNILHMPNLVASAYMFSVGGNQDASQVFSVCDGNQFSAPGGTRRWASGFSQSGESLSAWQGSTGLSANSNDAGFADFADPTGTPFDLSIGASSTAIDAAVTVHSLYLDIFGMGRTDPGDVGAHDRNGAPL